MITADVKALQDTLSVLDLAALEPDVDVLLAARRVDINLSTATQETLAHGYPLGRAWHRSG